MAHIPLVVDAPQFDASESDATVSLIDVPTTIARLADANVPESWDGTDVRDRTNENTVFLGFENSEGISTAVIHCPWKYMCQQDLLTTSPETELLFDFISDPVESQNEIETAEGVYQKLQDKYQNYINEIKGNRLEAERDLWDPSKDLSKTVQESDNDVPSETPEGIDQRLEDLGYK